MKGNESLPLIDVPRHNPMPAEVRAALDWAGGRRIVWFPKERYTCAKAWSRIMGQMIPGCPGRPGMYDNPWRKVHTKDYWCYVYGHGRPE